MSIFRLRWLGVVAAVSLLTGCSKNPSAPAQVSGVVKYQNQPLKGGTITFHSKDSVAYRGQIYEDGTYAITDIPIGEMTVTVDTEGLKPVENKATYGSRQGHREPAYRPPGLADRLDPNKQKAEQEGKYVKIPLRYKDPKSSDLKATLEKGKNKKDFELTD